MLIPMFQARGLPLHPGLLANTRANNLDSLATPAKLKVNEFIRTNKLLSCLPPAKPGLSRNLIKHLGRHVIYKYYEI